MRNMSFLLVLQFSIWRRRVIHAVIMIGRA